MPKHAKTDKDKKKAKKKQEEAPVEPAAEEEGTASDPEGGAPEGSTAATAEPPTENDDRAEAGAHAGGGQLDEGALPEIGLGTATSEKPSPADKQEIPPHLKKSKRTRIVLIVAIILLVALLGVMVYFIWQFVLVGNNSMTQTSGTPDTTLQQDDTKDAATVTTKKTEVPKLPELMGKTLDESVAYLKRGAYVASNNPVNQEGSPVKSEVKVSLTDEPGDTRSGTPTVYLSLNEDGKVISAGYSAPTSSLGYGTISFVDAVKNEKIIEKTLAEAGVTIPEGSVTLPANKADYSTYASDGTTLVTEKASFDGTVDINGTPYKWSTSLRYDYTAANASGLLSDTIRQIYVYVNV